MADLAQQSDGLQPAETFLDLLLFPLADAVAFLPCRQLIDGAAARAVVVLSHMRGHLHMAGLRDQVKVMIGGGPVDASVCEFVGADA